MSNPVAASTLIESSAAYPLVIGCSLFSIGWGILNVIMVSTLIHTKSLRPWITW